MKPNKKIHRYFRINDVVMNKSIWGNKLFIIHGFGGNNYCPELYVHFYGKPQTNGNSCNWDVRDTILIDSNHRPLKKLKKELLLKLLKKGNEEAKREYLIRLNQK